MNSHQDIDKNHPINLAYSFAETMHTNEAFLKENGNIALEEVVWLINDVIDINGRVLKWSNNKEIYVSRSIFFYIFHIMQPNAYSICLDLLASNIPACYFELRLLLETLVKSYISDMRFPNISFYQDRMRLLDESERNISNMMVELGKYLDIADGFINLWKDISEKWIHTKGIMDKIVENITEYSNVPPWGLLIPMGYSKGDINELRELHNNISKFRKLLKTSIEKYLSEI